METKDNLIQNKAGEDAVIEALQEQLMIELEELQRDPDVPEKIKACFREVK